MKCARYLDTVGRLIPRAEAMSFFVAIPCSRTYS